MTLVRRLQAHVPAPTRSSRALWCGPYAVAVLGRTDYDTAFEDIRALLGVKRLQRMYGTDLMAALTRPGWYRVAAKETFRGRGVAPGMRSADGTRRSDARPTFAAWLRTRDRKAVYLVILSHHFVVVAGDRVIDNQMLAWTSVAASKHRRTRVLAALRLEAQT